MSSTVFDPAYEFDAPRYFDFSQAENSGDGDSFFDEGDQICQPSPEKHVKGKKTAPAVVNKLPHKVPAPVPNGQVLTTAMRALRLTNGVAGNKEPAKPEVCKEQLKLPNRPRYIRHPSPTVGVKKCKPQSPTKPKSFAFQTEQRARLPRKRELFGSNNPQSGQTSGHGSSTSINTATTRSNGFGVGGATSKAAFPKSASQESVRSALHPKNTMYRRSALLGRRSASAGQLSENQPPAFKARPVPRKTLAELPLKQSKPPTQPQPFKFLANQNKEKLDAKKIEEQRRQVMFHARPMPDFSKTPFGVRAGEKHVTAPEPILLHTERRAEKRKAFDVATKKREEEIKEEIAQRENEKRRTEENEIRKLRKMLVHRALPIKVSKPMEIKRGVIASTKPETPKFLIDQRLKQRSLRPQNDVNGKL